MLCQSILPFIVLIHLTTWKGSTAQLTYTVKPTWFDDPEEPWTVAPNEDRWTSRKENAESLGLTFAGRVEFPWIVDIRIDHTPVETWSTGNLIKQDTVFTTCRAIDELGDWHKGTDTPRVSFAQMYLWEYTLRDLPQKPDWLFGGTRSVSTAQKHKKCNMQQAYYDGGLITLINSITPSPPTINTIQLTIDYKTGLLAEFDLKNMDGQRRICYIGSFGRDYANIKNHLVKDFKVKYRVYYEDPSLCEQWKHAMCPNHQYSKEACTITGINDEGKELMCFKSRAKVGAVCDHDKGAPLVCDGQVFGLVILGALQNKCNDVLPLPFWVQKITMFEDYFQPKADGPSGNRNLRVDSRSVGSAAVPSNLEDIPYLMSILFIFIICKH